MTARNDSLPARRRFLSSAGVALAAVSANSMLVSGQNQPVLLPPYLADIDGDGQLGSGDTSILQTALLGQRGFDLTPSPNFDYRADVFGRGVIENQAIESIYHSVQFWKGRPNLQPRPITVAWHYGWYNTLDRPPGTQTVRFKNGNYYSFDPEIETVFNDLKNEFGVSVDALSWIPARNNKDNQTNYRLAFLKAPNVDTRRVCLLYESTIALPFSGDRINFQQRSVQSYLLEDFAEMARFLREIRDDTPAKVFTLDNRPVIFIFGSHTWGVVPYLWGVSTMITGMRKVFSDIYGSIPFIVGEEMYLSSKGEFSEDRRRRTRYFDAVYVYHHASNLKRGREVTLQMTPNYIQNQVNILRRTYSAVNAERNVFTGQPVLVIPNLAPGFAKPGHPTLQLGRGAYGDFMKLLKGIHETWWTAFSPNSPLSIPVYVIGSWNEEFEGHCICPFDFNLSVPNVVQQGFDLSMAVKEVFGWNHYVNREP